LLPVSRLAIIIPLCGDAESFEDTLVSVLQNRPGDSEILVVTSGRYDDPYDLADELTFVAAPVGAGLVEQINQGFQTCRSEVVHVIQCGLEAPEGWNDAALARFAEPGLGAVAPLIVDRREERIISAGVRSGAAGCRREVLAGAANAPRNLAHADCIGPSLLAGFWRKSAWERAGGFDAYMDDAADLDFALTLRKLGYTCAFECASRLIRGVCARASISSWRNGLVSERVYWKHAPRSFGARLRHALDLAAAFAMGLPRPRRMVEVLAQAAVFGRFGGGAATVPGGAPSPPGKSLGELGTGNAYRRRSPACSLPESRAAIRARAVQAS
jgi:hypothetical protein